MIHSNWRSLLGVTMRNKWLLALVCLALLACASPAQEEKKEKKPLTNADIVLMTKNQFDDETLLKIIEVSDTDFDISGDALVDMKNQGVSSAVLRAMLDATRKRRRAGSAGSAPLSASPEPAANTPNNSSAATASTPAADKISPPANASAAPAAAASGTSPSAASSRAPMAATSSSDAAAIQSMAGGMRINPQQMQQMAAMQNPMAILSMMGMGGMEGMGSMFGGGMPSMNYTAEQLPHVFLLDDQVHRQKHEVIASTALIAQTKYNTGQPSPGGTALRNLAQQGLSFAAMSAGPMGMMAMTAFSAASGFLPGMRPGAPSFTYVWGLPGRKSTRQLNDKDPVFELSYGDIPGVDPDAFEPAIVQLIQSPDNYRLVGATRTKLNTKNMMSGNGPENGKWITEERWPTRVYKEDRGFYVLRVEQPLVPGEYAVVLRPVKGYKASPSGLGGHAQVFYSVWDFSVPGATPEDIKKKKK